MDNSVTLPGPEIVEACPTSLHLSPCRFAAWLALLIIAAHFEVLIGTHSFFYRDYTLFGYPLAFHLKESLWRGELPLWNPLNNCGLPFLAQWNTMALYPLSLLYVLLPLPWSLSLFNLAHLFLAGLGMYFLARRWTGNELAAGVAGIGFAFSGLSLHCLMWPNNIAALGWMPWVVWLAERGWNRGGRSLLLAAAVAATQVLAGAPEVLAFTWWIIGGTFVGAVCLSAGRRGRLLVRFAFAASLVIGLTAAQMLPFLDLLLHSQRHRGFGGDVWAMPAWGWANLLVPMFHCTPSRIGVFGQDAQQWTSSYYPGIGLLALALLGVCRVRRRVVWFFGAVALCGLVMALGKNGYVQDGLKQLLPALGFIRFPIKFVVLAAFAIPLLAAFGFDWIQRRSAQNQCVVRRAIMVAAGLFLAGLLVIGFFAFHAPVEGESWLRTVANGVSRGFFLFAVLGLTWITAPARRHWRLWGLALLLVISLDGWTHMPRQNPTVASAAFGPLKLSTSDAPRLGEGRAMISPVTQSFLENASPTDPEEIVQGHRRSLFSNCNLIEGVPKVNGFYSLYLKEETEVRALLDRSTNTLLAPLADFLGVTQISSDQELFDWTERTNALPLVSIGQRPVCADREETLRGLAAPGFDPREIVYLPTEARSRVSSSPPGRARIVSKRVTLQRVDVEIDASAPAMLVVAQSFYHPWRAAVDDGQEVRIWRANHAFQALEVPAGSHRVRLVYRDRRFEAGVVVTALSILVWSLGWFRFRSREDTLEPS
jgi:hypothetical protein